jgi:hypothetical protein
MAGNSRLWYRKWKCNVPRWNVSKHICNINVCNRWITTISPHFPLVYLQVSWIRKRDLHILTAGILTYTSDARFQVIRPDKSDNWTLQIKFPQERDSGIYECQVNTEPKMSLAFRLNVIGKWNVVSNFPRNRRKWRWSMKTAYLPHWLGI